MKKIKRVDDWGMAQFLISKGCQIVDFDNKGRHYFANDDWLKHRLEWLSFARFIK